MPVKFKNSININDQYTLPTQDGSNGQALITDGSGNISFGSTGVPAPLYIDYTNNRLGIGTSSPSYKLHVQGNVNANVNATVENTNAGTSAYATYRLKNNSISSAALFLNSSTNTGYAGGSSLNMYQGGNHSLGFVTNNLTRMVVKGNGNVGIGTASPSGKLDIKSAMGSSGQFNGAQLRLLSTDMVDATGFQGIRFATSTSDYYGWTMGANRSNNGRGSLRFFEHTGNSSGAERFTIKQDGNVGIGTSSPSEKLEVAGSVGSFKTTGHQIFLTRNGNNEIYAVGVSSVLALGQNGSEKMRINTDGNVGIGTASPDAKLEVNSGGGIHLSDDVAGRTLIIKPSLSGAVHEFTSDNTAAGYSFSNNASELMRIASNGNVGIGTTTPGQKLDVSGNISLGRYNGGDFNRIVGLNDAADGYGAGSSYIEFEELSGTGTSNITKGGNIRFYNHLYSGGTNETLSILANGNVGIGTTSPSYKLEVQGPTDSQGFVNDEGGNKNRLLFPKGGSYNGGNPITGAIKVTLPTSWTNTMLTITVRVFDYSTGESFDLTVAGYTYTGAPGWVNTSAWLSSQSNIDKNFTVRFGHDGTKCCFYIGELTSTWSYLKVNVIDATLNHSSTVTDWSTTAWAVGVESTAFLNVTRTHTDTQTNNWARNGQDVYYASGTGNVGIGTTSPNGKLEVDGIVKIGDVTTGLSMNGSGATEFLISGVDTVGSAWNSVHIKADGNDGLFIEKDTNNVGIGTTSPSHKLQVQDRIHIQDTTNLQPKISFSENTNSSAQFALEYNGVGGGAGNYVSFYSEQSGWVSKGNGLNYIPYNGYVGIGTTSPDSKLTVSGAGSTYVKIKRTVSGSEGQLSLGAATNFNSIVSRDGSTGGKDLTFETQGSGTESMRITSAGNATFANNVTVGNNLIVNGTTTTLNTQTVEVEDNILQLNTTQGTPDTATAATSGISVYRGDGVTQASLIFDEADDTWDLTNSLSVASKLSVGSIPMLSTGGAAKLSVGGILSIGVSDADLSYIRRQSSGVFQWQTYNNGNTGELQLQPYGGNIGIGTTSPGTINGVAFSSVGLHTKSGTLGRTITEGSQWGEYIMNNSGETANRRAKFIQSKAGDINIGSYDDNGTQRLHARLDNNGTFFLGNTSTAYQTVFFDSTPGTVYGNGTLQISPLTSPGSGIAQFTTNFADKVGSGTTKHNVRVGGTVTATDFIGGSGAYLPLAGGTMSGDLYLDDGNGASPSLYFKNQADNYWRFLMESNGSFSIKEGTASRLTFSSGDVGIGTTAPGAKLDIVGSSLGIRVKQADLSDVLRVYTQGSGIFMDNGNVHISDDLKIGATLLSNQENTDVDTGTETIANVAIATYTAAFFDFVVKNGTNVRSGTVYACHDGTNVEFTETSTNDLGDTSDVTLSVDISGGNMRLLATTTSDNWSVKSLIRAI